MPQQQREFAMLQKQKLLVRKLSCSGGQEQDLEQLEYDYDDALLDHH
jgi:hypothetical protein